MVIASAEIMTLLTLTSLEIVLGVDNIVFIALLVQHLPAEQRNKARFIGVGLALIMRIIMLFGATWLASLTDPLFSIHTHTVSVRDMLMLIGGGFLIVKSIKELREMSSEIEKPKAQFRDYSNHSFRQIIGSIIFIDLVLSFDSIITAVGMTTNIVIIVIAIVIAMTVMLFSVQPLGAFLEAHPEVRVIAICFILLVGVYLTALGFHYHIPKGYLYMAMFFSSAVEGINIYLEKKRVRFHPPHP